MYYGSGVGRKVHFHFSTFLTFPGGKVTFLTLFSVTLKNTFLTFPLFSKISKNTFLTFPLFSKKSKNTFLTFPAKDNFSFYLVKSESLDDDPDKVKISQIKFQISFYRFIKVKITSRLELSFLN